MHIYVYIQKRLSPLQLRTLSTDSLQVSTSPSGSLGTQHNLPLKRASRSITSTVICELHSTYHLQTTLAGQIMNLYSMCNVLRWLENIQFNALSTWQQHFVTTSPLGNKGTMQGETYSEWKTLWYFPHGCCKFVACWEWWSSNNQICSNSLYCHLLVLYEEETEKNKILPVWRCSCDCLEIRESNDWTI